MSEQPPAPPPADGHPSSADTGRDGAPEPAGRADAPGDEVKPGPELARAVLDAAGARRPAGRRRRAGAPPPGDDGSSHGSSWSGPAPDRRDPQRLDAVLASVIRARGWQRPAAEATVFGQWERVVGPEVAEHCRPVTLVDGQLTIEATSTAWATQLRLLAGSLLRQIAAEVGHDVVTRLRIHGPAAPSWRRGPRRVRGRGPRDTYG